jgi:16S rRNA (guanine527-N7)-methyltransferase
VKPELERYARLLEAWPANLVSASDLERLEAHVEDALAGAPLLSELGAGSVVDVGTGAGLPGIPLAVELGQVRVELLESRERKAAFLRHAVDELGLGSRVRVWQERSEEAVEAIGREAADVATCRALAAPVVAAELLSPYVRPGGALVLWTTTTQAALVADTALPALGLDGPPTAHPAPSALRTDGVLLVWPKPAPAEARFPRRAGVALRKPLA